jgi:hypothetical protein
MPSFLSLVGVCGDGKYIHPSDRLVVDISFSLYFNFFFFIFAKDTLIFEVTFLATFMIIKLYIISILI